MKLSIVTGTLNRLPYLKRCVASIEKSAKGIDHEIIIVDGGSMDGTQTWLDLELESKFDVQTILQGKPLGAVAAFNAGFAEARGEYVAAINDDAEYRDNSLARAVKMLDGEPRIGQVAIPFGCEGDKPKVQELPGWARQRLGVKNGIYANFSVTRKSIGDKCGWWGDGLYQYGGDTRLSIEVYLAGYEVKELRGGHVVHYQLHDDTRKPNIEADQLRMLYDPTTAWREEGKHKLQIGKGKHEVTRLKYNGHFDQLATFSENPSGKTYRIKLHHGLQFYIYSVDAKSFLERHNSGSEPMFEEI